MKTNVVDLSFLDELSGGDPKYIYDVLEIFMSTVPEGLKNLENLIIEGKDLQAVSKQAHALKSSASIVKVENMYDRLAEIEALGRDEKGIDRINELFEQVMQTFNEAEPVIIETRDKNKPAEEE